ncbi:hypothetical protein WR25_02094 [Diploscapter pachys]|uniref:ATP-dependent RNA helicase n=1 Tax=Diploscapter pachys TaxID=2018661 RepID=A0A2A2K6R8_9BILA|nr:hypothetical protein WR25_02094 [Diploscapter pachys]
MTTRSKNKKKPEIEEEQKGATQEVQINGKTGTISGESGEMPAKQDEEGEMEEENEGEENGTLLTDRGDVEMEEEEIPLAAEEAAPEEDYQKEFKVIGVEQFKNLVAVKSKNLLVENATTFPAEIDEKTKLQLVDREIDGNLARCLDDIRLYKHTKELFPVQKEVFLYLFKEIENPPRVRKRDLVICSPTGSGKTWCYVIPIVCHPNVIANASATSSGLERYYSDKCLCSTYALIVVPSQQLVKQVIEEFDKFSRSFPHVVGLSGAEDFDYEKRRLQRQRAHVVVCTPARLLLHLLEDTLDLEHLRYLVIDEADSMGKNVRNEWLELVEKRAKLNSKVSNSLVFAKLESCAPRKIILSATLSYDIDKLYEWALFQPKLFLAVKKKGVDENKLSLSLTTGSELSVALPTTIANRMLIAKKSLHPLVVFTQLKDGDFRKILIFVAEVVAAKRLAIVLGELGSDVMDVSHLTSELFGKRRQKILMRFADTGEKEKIRVLISSDVLARGVDVEDIDCVVNYDKPIDKRQYIHRGGRTGRSGKSGTVLTVCDDARDEVRFLRRICREVCSDWTEANETEIEENEMKGYMDGYRNAIEKLRETVAETQSKNSQNGKANKRAETSGFKYRPAAMKRRTPWRSKSGENIAKRDKFD